MTNRLIIAIASMIESCLIALLAFLALADCDDYAMLTHVTLSLYGIPHEIVEGWDDTKAHVWIQTQGGIINPTGSTLDWAHVQDVDTRHLWQCVIADLK